jgi:hypothetical protein
VAIMCTLKLKKALKGAGQLGRNAKPEAATGARLGNWAATVIREGKTDLVVALNERSYLTVVFRLRPLRTFRRSFVDALATALVDHGVPKPLIRRECAQLEAAAMTRLRDGALRGAVDAASYIAGIETCYHDDLRDVQWNVNQLPHGTVKPCVPTEGVRVLFGVPQADFLTDAIRQPSKEKHAKSRAGRVH